MKVWVQCAKKWLTGKRCRDQGRSGREKQDRPAAKRPDHQKGQARQNTQKTHGSTPLQQTVDIKRGADADIVPMGLHELVRCSTAFVTQHRRETPIPH